MFTRIILLLKLQMAWQENISDFYRKLKIKYKLIVLNDDTLQEETSLTATPLRFLVSIFSILIILTFLIIIMVSFTPLREYIPGYSDLTVRETAISNASKIDSLEVTLQQKDAYLNNIIGILQGKTPEQIKETAKTPTLPASLKNNKSVEDSLLRKYVEEQDQYNVFENTKTKTGYSFFTPLKGTITSRFEPAKKHFGVDIVAPKNETIKSVMDGTVITANWTDETGYVIAIQHPQNLISFYKHNSVLRKKVGEIVKAGDVIAVIGNSGELSTGPHLHFEIWSNGNPINPEDYIVF